MSIEKRVIDFATQLDESKNGGVIDFVVTRTRYHANGTAKKVETKYEVKCREKWTWREIIAIIPYITVIVIAIGMMVTLSRGCASDNACNISTTIKAVVGQM